MDTIKSTELLIYATITLVAVYDVWVAKEATKDDTISERIRYQSQFHHWLPFGWGVLLGHFFGPPLQQVPWWTPIVLAAIGVFQVFLGLVLTRYHGTERLKPEDKKFPVLGWKGMMTFAIAGIFAGALLWSQEPPEDIEPPTSGAHPVQTEVAIQTPLLLSATVGATQRMNKQE